MPRSLPQWELGAVDFLWPVLVSVAIPTQKSISCDSSSRTRSQTSPERRIRVPQCQLGHPDDPQSVLDAIPSNVSRHLEITDLMNRSTDLQNLPDPNSDTLARLVVQIDPQPLLVLVRQGPAIPNDGIQPVRFANVPHALSDTLFGHEPGWRNRMAVVQVSSP